MDNTIMSPLAGYQLATDWTEEREQSFAPLCADGMVHARIIAANREIFRVGTAYGEFHGYLAGKVHYALSNGQTEFPVVGDWAAVRLNADYAIIQKLLLRRNFISRQCAGATAAEQIVAANLDYLLIVMGLDRDFNLKRLDRYLAIARYGEVRPVVILTKADLCGDVPWHLARTSYEISADVPVHAISAVKDYGLAELSLYLRPGTTSLLVGSSGAGKSTLTNRLVGRDVTAAGALSEHTGRGRSITSSRTMHRTITGAFVIDNPGMREVQLWGGEEGLNEAFTDIGTLAAGCRFRNCRHQGEPGCAVQQALLNERLTPERFLNYMKLRHESQETKETLLRKKRARFKKIAQESRRRRGAYHG